MCLSNDLPCLEYCPPDISPQSQSQPAPAPSWDNSPAWLCPGADRGRGRWVWGWWGWGGRPPPLSGARAPSPPADLRTEAGSSSSQSWPPQCCVWPGPRTGSEVEISVRQPLSLIPSQLTVCPIFQCSSVKTPATRSLALNVSEWTFFPSTNHLTSISMLSGTMTSVRTALQWNKISDWRLFVVWVSTAPDILTVTKTAKTQC